MMKRPPFFVGLVSLVVVVGLVVLGLVTWEVHRIEERTQEHACERAVQVREDGRAMWLYLAGESTSDPKRIREFLVKLDELLPPLKCEGTTLVTDR